MKKIILSFALITSLISVSLAQNNVTLTINHFLGDQVFAMDQTVQTEMDHAFNLQRLQYYISEISVTHDGGQETAFEDVYALITNGNSASSSVDLGNHDITAVEKLTFHIGVDEEKNHLDPAIYAGQHPLAPKNPSMHWGWASGYRFIALEGMCGANMDEFLQFHCIGDMNYTQVELDMESMANAGNLNIAIDGDYIMGLSTIDVSSGVILHGDVGHNVTLAANFGDKVFSPSSTMVDRVEIEESVVLMVYPNPSNGENIQIELDLLEQEAVIEIRDIVGKKILVQNAANGINTVSIASTGIYMINIVSNRGQVLTTKKIIVE